MDLDPSAPLVVASVDSHIGPLLEEQLRDYCPAAHLDQFDEYVAEWKALPSDAFARFMPPSTHPEDRERLDDFIRRYRRNAVPGHHDPDARLADMDRDGIATEVIFHGSQNRQPVPFIPEPGGSDFSFDPTAADVELLAVGQRIYNRWLADFVAHAPERFLGVASAPMADVEWAVAEVEWAREAGLRGVNLPAPRRGVVEYDEPYWDPLWAACQALDMPLLTHGGAAFFNKPSGPHAGLFLMLEGGGWPSRRGLARMILGGVFARFPRLKLVLTEQTGDWWGYATNEMDSVWTGATGTLLEQVPRPPSEYMSENVYCGASFMAPFEARLAVEGGWSDNFMWGRDYPHVEGTFQNTPDDTGGNMTKLSLRHCFSGLAAEHMAKMVGDNLVGLFGLDRARLATIATSIGAPTLDELATPIESIPEEGGTMAFRTMGAWA